MIYKTPKQSQKFFRNNWSFFYKETPFQLRSSPDLNPHDLAIWGVLRKKTNATSHLDIVSLKTAVEKEWNKTSEEFILKACKSFRRRFDTIIEKKNGGPRELSYCFVFIFLFCCLFQKSK